MTQPLISFYTNSFNRLPLLQNLLRSFDFCNEYPHVEWIVTDYGSSDGSREWLRDYKAQANFPVALLLADEQEYFASLQLPKLDRRTKFEAILRLYRNQARAAAKGDYYFDVATDHQFIRCGNWVDEILNIFAHRREVVGRDDIAGVVPFGYFRWRLDKPNNSRYQEQNSEFAPYYVAKTKAYVDYSVMKAATATQIGLYWELSELAGHSELIKRWYEMDPLLHPESEYCRRCEVLDLTRVFMKYPILVSFKNRELAQLQTHDADDKLLAPIWTLTDLQRQFSYLRRPISSDELCRLPLSGVVAQSKAVLERARAWL